MKSVAFLGAKVIGLECLKILDAKKEQGQYSIDALFTDLTRNREANLNLLQFAEKKNIKAYENIDDILTLPEFDFIISVQYNKILKGNHISRATANNPKIQFSFSHDEYF